MGNLKQNKLNLKNLVLKMEDPRFDGLFMSAI